MKKTSKKRKSITKIESVGQSKSTSPRKTRYNMFHMEQWIREKMDWIILEQINVWAPIGVSSREREQSTALQVDLRLALDLSKAARSDQLADTLDYAALMEFVRSYCAQQSSILLEHLGESLCQVLFKTYPSLQQIEVALFKAGLLSNVKRVGVVLQRARSDG